MHIRNLGVHREDARAGRILGLDFRGNERQKCRLGNHCVLEATKMDKQGAEETAQGEDICEGYARSPACVVHSTCAPEGYRRSPAYVVHQHMCVTKEEKCSDLF